MYEVYYAYGMNKGTTITYTSTLEEATSFVKAKVFELSQKGIDAHCHYGIRKIQEETRMSKFNNEANAENLSETNYTISQNTDTMRLCLFIRDTVKSFSLRKASE